MDAESDIIDLTHPPMPIASSPITEAGGGSAGETSSFGDGVLIIGSGDVVQVREGDEGGAAYAEVDTALTGAVATHTVVDESAEDLASDRAVSAGLTTGDTAPRGEGAAVPARRPLGDSTNTAVVKAAQTSTPGGRDNPAKGKKRKRPREGDGERCTICLDPWTSKGKHRICTLLCGHLFGQDCIERWLKEKRTCPQCGTKVGPKGSIRVIPLYLSNLVAKDTGELETAREQLQDEKRLHKKCEAERVRLSILNASLKDKLARIRQRESSMNTPIKQAPFAHRQSAGRDPLAPAAGRPLIPASIGALPSTPGSGVPPSVGYATRTPSANGEARPHLSAAISPQETPAPWQGPVVVSTVANGDDEHGDDGGGGIDNGCHEAAPESVSGKTVVRFEHLTSSLLRGGRVSTFAGGPAGALIVSQEFGAAGGARGSMRHGITKFSLADLRHKKNVCLHREQVRDVKFSPHAGSAGYVLSTSFDRTLKVCDLRTDSVVVEYGIEANGWSCTWSATDPNQMLCGVVDETRMAAVALYDLRSTTGAVRKIRAVTNQRQPVHSICHTAEDELFCATMGGVWAWGGGTKGAGASGQGEGREEALAEQLQIQAGACCSLSQFHGEVREHGRPPHRFLVSTRGASARHAVYSLEPPSPLRPNAIRSESRDVDTGGVAVGRGQNVTLTTAVEGDAGNSSGEMLKNESDARLPLTPTGFGRVGDRRSILVEAASWAEKWRCVGVAQGHQSQHTLSRSLLWDPSRGDEVYIAGGDESSNEPCIWDASTGELRTRLAAHRRPVLDIASFQECSSENGLIAAVSQGEMRVYQTSCRR